MYHNIYPHIDWVLKINENNSFEYEYVVGAMGDARQIKMEYKGANSIKLSQNGDLVINTKMGNITEQAPLSYTQSGQFLGSKYVLRGNILSYQTDPYAGALVIDPKVAWATYYGDTTMWISTDSKLNKIHYDKNGKLYIAGGGSDKVNIATTGAYQQHFKAFGFGTLGNAFYIKMDTNGKRLYATYFSSDSSTGAFNLSSYNNFVYLSGVDKSNKLATIGVQQTSFKPLFTSAPFLAQFDTSGLLNWCTYVGGNNKYSQGAFCFVDVKGDVYMLGSCDTFNPYISTVGSHKAIQSDSFDAFIIKYNPSGMRI